MSILSRSQVLLTTILSIVVLIAMALFPASATGKEDYGSYGLKVIGKPVTDENKNNILGDDAKTMSFEPETRTLRLENATVEISEVSYGIESLDVLIVELIGKNTISAPSPFLATSALSAKGITFEGEGSLDVVTGDSSHGIDAIVTGKNGIEINGPTITTKTGFTSRGGAAAMASEGPITINSGVLKAESGVATSSSSGISTTDTITINGGTVEASGSAAMAPDDDPIKCFSSGMYAKNGITINGGNVISHGVTNPEPPNQSLGFHVTNGSVDIAEHLEVTVSKSADGSNPIPWDRSIPLHTEESPYQYVKITSTNHTQPKPSVPTTDLSVSTGSISK